MDNLFEQYPWRNFHETWRFWNSLHLICNDGVHLKEEGLWKYYRSVRSANLHAYNILGNIYPFRIYLQFFKI